MCNLDDAAGSARRWPSAPVITGCLLGCVLPVFAYAEATSALFGFGAVPRKWAWLLIAAPTAVWLLAGLRVLRGPVANNLVTTALALAAQMLIAVVVSLAIKGAIRGRTGRHG